jgi:lipopolysaccharide/colanic/teichoic acid biosynthesis glycosyltransferase
VAARNQASPPFGRLRSARSKLDSQPTSVDLDRVRYDTLKRVLDVVGAILLFILTLPLMAAIAVGIKLSSPGPIFYRGIRVGRFGRPFWQWKFRTMVVNAESIGGSKTTTLDGRITCFGRFLRSAKLDELPQLYNVIRGDMSLVGPRPMVPAEVDRYSAFERAALSVRPGVTDWASVWFHNEERELSLADDIQLYYETIIRPEKARLRVAYVHNRSMRVDLSIVAQTIYVLLRTRLQPARENHNNRPFRLWGYRPVRSVRSEVLRRSSVAYPRAPAPEPLVAGDAGERARVANFDASSA